MTYDPAADLEASIAFAYQAIRQRIANGGKILNSVHSSAKRLHGAGLMDDVTMREFDALCAPNLNSKVAAANPTGERQHQCNKTVPIGAAGPSGGCILQKSEQLTQQIKARGDVPMNTVTHVRARETNCPSCGQPMMPPLREQDFGKVKTRIYNAFRERGDLTLDELRQAVGHEGRALGTLHVLLRRLEAELAQHGLAIACIGKNRNRKVYRLVAA